MGVFLGARAVETPDQDVEQRTMHPWLRPSIVTAMIYILFLGLLTLIHHYNILTFIHQGTIFTMHDPKGSAGYDGQFYYYLARDPGHAYEFMDNAPYRYQRIIYPMLVRLLSLGQVALIPYMLLLVNGFSIVLSVELIAQLLAKRGLSPWYSLALGLYFGQATALVFDTAEPFTYLLICIGIWLVARDRRTLGALFMGLAVLSRETAILFPLGYTLYALWHRRWRDVISFVILSLVPLPIWYLILWKIFGNSGLSYAPPFEHIPFGGLFTFWSQPTLLWSLFAMMGIPTLGNWLFSFRAIIQRRWDHTLAIWLMHLVLVTFMAAASYQEFASCGRLSTGLILATLLYGLYNGDRTLLRASQVYTLTFLPYTAAIMWIPFVN